MEGWIPDSIHKEKVPFLRERVNAHIKISSNKYCQVAMLTGFSTPMHYGTFQFSIVNQPFCRYHCI